VAIALIALRIGDPTRLALDPEQDAITMRTAWDRRLAATPGFVGRFPPGAASAVEDHGRSPLKAIGKIVECILSGEVVNEVPPVSLKSVAEESKRCSESGVCSSSVRDHPKQFAFKCVPGQVSDQSVIGIGGE
jgi:hypothetical protein